MLRGCLPASWNMVVPLIYRVLQPPGFFNIFICLLVWLHQVFSCSMQGLFYLWRVDLQLQHVNSWLPYVGSSSLTRDQTWAPCIWEQGVLAIGPPGKSLQPPVLKTFMASPVCASCCNHGLGHIPTCQNGCIVLWLAVVCSCHKNMSSWWMGAFFSIGGSLMGPMDRPPQTSDSEEHPDHSDIPG